MPRRPRLTAAVRRQVAAREGYRCAYCRSPQRVGIPMVVDHILPRDAWAAHFAWQADRVTLAGLTPVGRVTIVALRLNEAWMLEARQLWIVLGLHPPLET